MMVRIVPMLTLTVVWLLLWGRITPWLILGGLLISWLILTVFPFPRAPWLATVRPLPLLVLIVRFGIDLVRASFEVAWLAIRPQAPPASAVIRVQLRTHSELLMTVTAELVSLVPGSLVIEIDPGTAAIYLHVLDGSTPETIERARKAVTDQETQVVRAIAPRAERDAIFGVNTA